MVRATFPPLQEKDLREAVGLELDRLLPLPADTLRFGYIKVPEPAEEGKVSLVVAAVSRDYMDRCGQLLSRAGLSPAGSVPSAWAAGSAMTRLRGRSTGSGKVYPCCSAGWESPLNAPSSVGRPRCSAPPAAVRGSGGKGRDLPRAGGAGGDARWIWGSGGAVRPAGLVSRAGFQAGPDEIPFRVANDFQARASEAMFESRFPSGVSAPETFLCAYGAAVGGKERDLQASARSVAISRAARKAVLASAAAAFLLGIAWPASVTLKAREDLRRLDLRAAELRPFAERHEASIAEVRNVREKLAVLQDWEAAPGLAIMMLKEITDRFPNGTWISSLRIEGRSVEMEGSPPRRASCSPR